MTYSEYLITLADGTRLALCAGDEQASRVIAFLAEVACLSPVPTPLPPATRRLLVTLNGHIAPGERIPEHDSAFMLDTPSDARLRLHRRWGENGQPILEPVIPEPLTEDQKMWMHLDRLSAAVGWAAQGRGGVLLHSALVACSPFPAAQSGGANGYEEDGAVLLTGPSGVGKSTASARLPLPWRALCDDMTMVVHPSDWQPGGSAFWAHPWPTWSRFFGFEKRAAGGQWEVQRGVPLRAIFFLVQGPEDQAERMGPAEAVCCLLNQAKDASKYLSQGWALEDISKFNRQRFENLCALAKAVPAFRLRIRHNGSFWERMEEALRSSAVSRVHSF